MLPLARPPCDLLQAGHAGRSAQLDAALYLFVSNAVRRFRSATGDPVAVISTHDDGDVRVSLSSQFDDTTVEGFRWPLHPLDEIALVASSIAGLLAECRINIVHCVARVLPATTVKGRINFLTLRDAETLDGNQTQH